MNIQVVGTGCPTCHKLYEIASLAAKEIDPNIRVEYVSGQDGIKRLMELGLVQSPALLVNGKIAMLGYRPGVQQMKNLILEAAQ